MATEKPVDQTVEQYDEQVNNKESSNLELGPRATYLSGYEGLSQEDRDYLLQRHGTLDLDPMPSGDPADPYNWPQWRKVTNLLLVSFHSFMCVFSSAALIPAFEPVSIYLDTSLTRTAYLVSLTIAVLGFGPLVWKPLSNRYGRRPIWLLTTFASGILNIGCAVAPTYGTIGLCRALQAFFISSAYIGSVVVTESFFKRERGSMIGVWTLLTTLGPPCGPCFMGFVTEHLNFRWIFWILAIINFVQFILYIFFGPETRYIRKGVRHVGSAFKQEYLHFGRIDPEPLSWWEFVQPFALFKYASIFLPTLAYAIVFGFSSVLLTVEIPQLYVPKFGFNPQQIGLQFLGLIIGSIIGEQLGGRLSDFWMKRRAKKLDRPADPEHRLWLSYLGFLLAMIGYIVFCVCLENSQVDHWTVSPIIGVALAGVGNQIVTAVLVTYALDCHVEQSASIGVFVNFIRSEWGFIGPFWFPSMFTTPGIGKSAGIMVGMVVIFSVIPIAALHFKGAHWRPKKAANDIPEDELTQTAMAVDQ